MSMGPSACPDEMSVAKSYDGKLVVELRDYFVTYYAFLEEVKISDSDRALVDSLPLRSTF